MTVWDGQCAAQRFWDGSEKGVDAGFRRHDVEKMLANAAGNAGGPGGLFGNSLWRVSWGVFRELERSVLFVREHQERRNAPQMTVRVELPNRL